MSEYQVRHFFTAESDISRFMASHSDAMLLDSEYDLGSSEAWFEAQDRRVDALYAAFAELGLHFDDEGNLKTRAWDPDVFTIYDGAEMIVRVEVEAEDTFMWAPSEPRNIKNIRLKVERGMRR